MGEFYNTHPNDIRLRKISIENVEGLIKSFEGSWIYVKSSIDICGDEDSVSDFTGLYFKFKIRNISIDDDYIRIYGFEDSDRLIINKTTIVQSEGSIENNEIKLILENENIYNEIFIKKYSPRIDKRIEDILQSNSHLIITEGKTDWKHLKNALNSLKESGNFSDLDISFFEYEDNVKMGNKTLEKVCNYNSLFKNDYLKIFVYDADDIDINSKHEEKTFLYYGNNIYSMVLPIPKHRESFPLISIEHYYTDSEIKTMDSNGRRLFLAYEFDNTTKKHNTIKNTYALKVNPNVEPNLIIDDKIYNTSAPVNKIDDIFNSKDKVNLALSKNDFAEYVLQGQYPFNNFSMDSFSKFFDIVNEIYKEYIGVANKDNAIEISRGIYHECLDNGYQEIRIECSMRNDTALRIKNSNMFGVEMNVTDSKDQINLLIFTTDGEHLCSIPITISDTLIDFLIAKTENNFNRMYLHVYDEGKNHISFKEILSSDGVSIIINQVLHKLSREI